MHFSITCALFLCVTMLFFPPVQGKYALNKGPAPPCCPKVSTARVRKAVKECYEQLPNKFPHCGVHAYIFITVDDKQYCVDPNVDWLQTRLEKLQKNGKRCKDL